MQKIAVIPVSDEGRDIAETLQQEFQASVIKRAEVAKRWKHRGQAYRPGSYMRGQYG